MYWRGKKKLFYFIFKNPQEEFLYVMTKYRENYNVKNLQLHALVVKMRNVRASEITNRVTS